MKQEQKFMEDVSRFYGHADDDLPMVTLHSDLDRHLSRVDRAGWWVLALAAGYFGARVLVSLWLHV